MYIGRFVIVGKTEAGAWYLAYRVSSRSFPNRRIAVQPDRAMVVPTEDAPRSDNPYISYNCMRMSGSTVVVANGTQVDPIIDKVSLGMPLRDAMALSLLALDYEHDDYNTPRVVAAVDGASDEGYLGIVGDDRVIIKRMEATPGEAYLVATYELTDPTPISLAGETAEALCDAVYECEYERPVAALAVLLGEGAPGVAARSACNATG